MNTDHSRKRNGGALTRCPHLSSQKFDSRQPSSAAHTPRYLLYVSSPARVGDVRVGHGAPQPALRRVLLVHRAHAAKTWTAKTRSAVEPAANAANVATTEASATTADKWRRWRRRRQAGPLRKRPAARYLFRHSAQQLNQHLA